MGGLRALCCGKGDEGDDNQQPIRPTQPRPEKTTQNAPINVKSTSSTDVTPAKSTPEGPAQEELTPENSVTRDLWKEAFDSIDPSRQPYVETNGLSATTAINKVIEDTTAKYEEWQKGGLKIDLKGRAEFNIRDCAENILGAAMKFSGLISKAVSFDPTGKASTAWMVISFGMSVVQNRLDRRDAIFAASEYLAETLAYHALIDLNYRNQDIGTDHNLDQALLRVYTAILEYTVEVKKGRDESEAKSAFQSLLPLTDQPLAKLKEVIESQSLLAEKWIQLATNLGDRERAAKHLAKADEALARLKKIETTVLNTEEEKKLAWISDAPYSVRQRDLQRKKTDNTGLWLLDTAEYKEWKTVPGSLLWLPGISGCVGHHPRGSQPDSAEVNGLLDDLLSGISGDVYLVFDALDECPHDQGERYLLLSRLEHLLKEHSTKIHILATSRPEQDISRIFDQFRTKIDLEAHLAEDVKTYVTDCLEKLHHKRWKPDTYDLIRDELLNSKERRFRWAELQIFTLGKLVQDKQVRNALNQIPPTLEASYRKVLDEIDSFNEEFARGILVIICLSPVVLDAQTVADMMDLSYPEAILDICTTMFVNLFEDQIKIAHFSVQEFLIVPDKSAPNQHHPCQFSTVEGHNYLTELTVDILLEETKVLTPGDVKDSRHAFWYAGNHWATHMAAAGGFDELSPELQAKVNRLFTESNVYVNWVRAADTNEFNNDFSKVLEECQPPFHRALKLGLVQPIDSLIAQGADPLEAVKTPSPFTDNLFSLAAWEGRIDVLQSLLNRKLPLGREQVVVILLAIDHQKSGKFNLESILQTLWDQGLLCEHSSETSDQIDEDVLTSVAYNGKSGREILEVFRKWEPKISVQITDQVMMGAVCSCENLDSALGFLLENYDIHVSPALLAKFEDTPLWSHRINGLALLAIRRPNEFPISEELFEDGFKALDVRILKLLMQTRRSDIRVTESMLKMALKVPYKGVSYFRILWPYREPGIAITDKFLSLILAAYPSQDDLEFLAEQIESGTEVDEETIIRALRKKDFGLFTLKLFVSLSGPDFSEISESLAKSICFHKDAPAMLSFLANDKGLEIPITEAVLIYAASNPCKGSTIIEDLANLNKKPLPVTEALFTAAVQNYSRGGEVLEMLLQLNPSVNLLTDSVFEEACHNPQAMTLLLDKRQQDLPIEGMLQSIIYGRFAMPHNMGASVLSLLLKRNIVHADEFLVETVARSVSFEALDALISFKPDAPITKKAFMAASCDPRSMRVMMSVPGTDLLITEDVLATIVQGRYGGEAIQVIEGRTGSLDITEKVLKAALKDGYESTVAFLLERTPKPVITKLFQETWPDVDLLGSDARCAMLEAYLKHTGSKITYSLLQDWPFDREKEENHGLDRLGDWSSELFENPDAEQTAAIFVERCSNGAIVEYLESKRIVVTDGLIEAAERNPIVDKERLKSFLEQIRG